MKLIRRTRRTDKTLAHTSLKGTCEGTTVGMSGQVVFIDMMSGDATYVINMDKEEASMLVTMLNSVLK